MAKRKLHKTRKPRKATRLPSGKYAWRGRAVSFSKLPKKERSRFRSLRAAKAGKTRKRAATLKRKQAIAAKSGIIVAFRVKHKTRSGEVIPAVFMADKLPGMTNRMVIEAIRAEARKKVTKDARGSWIANADWPDDERSEPSRPYNTIVALPIQTLDGNILGDAEDYMDEVEEDGSLFLDRQKSGAKGTAEIKTIEWAVFYGLK